MDEFGDDLCKAYSWNGVDNDQPKEEDHGKESCLEDAYIYAVEVEGEVGLQGDEGLIVVEQLAEEKANRPLDVSKVFLLKVSDLQRYD